jgi:hypothetical protein
MIERLQIATYDPRRERFIFTRGAAALFGIAAALALGAVILIHSNLTLETFGFLNRREFLVLGLATAIGFAALFAGMGTFWLNCDDSSKINRIVWFAILLLGSAYGSQIAYYAFVYLPAVAKRLRTPSAETTGMPTAQDESKPRGIGRFGKSLLAGWVLFFLTFAAHLVFPGQVHRGLLPILKAVVLWPFFMLAATILYAIVYAFRFGMRRPSSS